MKMLMMFAGVTVIVGGLLILSGCATDSADVGRPLLENGRPLTFQIMRAYATSQPQLLTQQEIALTGFDLNKATVPGYIYTGPTEVHYTYKNIDLPPLASFIIVNFSVQNVSRTLKLARKDVELVDGTGNSRQALGSAFPIEKDAWLPFDSSRLEPGISSVRTWLFIVPDNAIAGCSIRFQGATYPFKADEDLAQVAKLQGSTESAEDFVNRGDVKKSNGDWDGAIADFTKVIELNPTFADAYFNRGFAKANKGDLDGAIADYNRAIELNPNYADAYYSRSYAKKAKGDQAGADADLAQAAKLGSR
jgi:tetratricopeptide (TPR) repeat protein